MRAVPYQCGRGTTSSGWLHLNALVLVFHAASAHSPLEAAIADETAFPFVNFCLRFHLYMNCMSKFETLMRAYADAVRLTGDCGKAVGTQHDKTDEKRHV